jgi:aspartyl-tRNA(Asn)/glutamyl-tRNA(Gln) amidotransferase subunit B
MFDTNEDPEVIVKKEGLEVVSDEGALKETVKKVVDANPQSVADYKAGKEKAVGFLVGQAMKETRGKGNPQLLNKLIIEYLNK